MRIFTSKNKQNQAPPSTAALTREVASVASDLHEPLLLYAGARPAAGAAAPLVVPNRDPLLTSRQPDSAYAWPYGLLEEALDKDAHLSAIVAQRKAAVLSWERKVVPADGSPAAAAAAQLVEQALAGIGGSGGGLERDLSELLDAIPYGFAISEVVWGPVGAALAAARNSGPPDACGGANTAGAGKRPPYEKDARGTRTQLFPAELKSRHPRRFVFDTAGQPRLLTAAEPVTGEPLPPRKLLAFSPYGRHENPYGLPALRSVWWLTYFKRQALKFWVMHAEKFGSPTAVLRYPLGATEADKRAYRRLIGSVQQECGLVVPEGVELSLLEAQRSGTVQTYSELVDLCNREMSKALLGQTLTVEPGERGARSLGEVHMAVREDIVRGDAKALMAAVNGQLVAWIMELNLPPGTPQPRWELTPPRRDDIALQLEVDRFFAERGLPLDEAELYERYGRSRPVAS